MEAWLALGGLIFLLTTGVATMSWWQLKQAKGDIKDNSQRISGLSEKVAVIGASKVSREELSEVVRAMTKDIKTAIEEKQAIRDQRTEENYREIKEKLAGITEVLIRGDR